MFYFHRGEKYIHAETLQCKEMELTSLKRNVAVNKIFGREKSYFNSFGLFDLQQPIY